MPSFWKEHNDEIIVLFCFTYVAANYFIRCMYCTISTLVSMWLLFLIICARKNFLSPEIMVYSFLFDKNYKLYFLLFSQAARKHRQKYKCIQNGLKLYSFTTIFYFYFIKLFYMHFVEYHPKTFFLKNTNKFNNIYLWGANGISKEKKSKEGRKERRGVNVVFKNVNITTIWWGTS